MSDRIPTGVVPPLPTFLTEGGDLDLAAERRLLARALDAGVDGVVMLGTSGEGPVLPASVRRATLAAAQEACADRAPFLAGCVGHTVDQALTQIQEADDFGAAGALLLPPFYFRIDQPALVRHFTAIAKHSPIPVVLYHIPAMTSVGLKPETVQNLAQIHNIAGLKDSDRDLVYHATLCQVTAHEEFAIFQEAAPLLLPSLSLGNTDTICPVSALVPQWELAMRESLSQGDLEGARVQAFRVSQLAALFGLPGAPMPANFKAVARALGLGTSRSHEALFDSSAESIAVIHARLQELGMEVVDV